MATMEAKFKIRFVRKQYRADAEQLDGAARELPSFPDRQDLWLGVLRLDLAEEGGGLFGRHRIDVKPGPPFEAGRLRQPRYDLDVPVIVVELRRVKGSGVQDVVVGRPIQRGLDLGYN